jgi:hypothetical protein
LSHSVSSVFVNVFRNRVLGTVCLGWLQITISWSLSPK